MSNKIISSTEFIEALRGIIDLPGDVLHLDIRASHGDPVEIMVVMFAKANGRFETSPTGEPMKIEKTYRLVSLEEIDQVDDDLPESE